ncbi:MAG: hypothetical protein K6E48_01825 [Lachnospiraceae bacterium]|nr:hypothetical protein [Lachnospiraceae bacterium]
MAENVPLICDFLLLTVTQPADFTVEIKFHKLHRNGELEHYGAPTGNSNTP